MLTIRSYRGGDEQGIVATWNAALTYDPIHMDRWVRRVLADVNVQSDGIIVACYGEEIVGFCLAFHRRVPVLGSNMESDTGWITALGVHPKRQKRGIGTELVRAAEAFLRRQGVTTVWIAPYTPRYFWPGVDEKAYGGAMELLKKEGYETMYVATAMDRNLVGFSIPDDVRRLKKTRTEEGYRIRSLCPATLLDVVTFAEKEFSPDWARIIRDTIAHRAPWHRIVYADHVEQGIAGFSVYGGAGGPQERYGPLGVSASQRGKGLGKILLYETLQSMVSDGLHGAWFLWTGEQTAAGHLYARAGFEVTRRFHVLSKRLDDCGNIKI